MEDSKKVIKYVALMQMLYEMSDDIVIKDTPFNTKVIAMRCSDLLLSLKKEVWRIYRGKKDGIRQVDDFVREEDWDRAVDQHQKAVERMSFFFDLGCQLEEMDEIRMQGFDTQLKILMKNYGINVGDE